MNYCFLFGGLRVPARHLGSVFLLVLGAYTLHTCLRERLRNASATARGAYARTFVSCRAYADAYARKSRVAFFQLELCNAKSIVV